MNVKEILTALFNHEAIIIILKGYWKTGKTNVGLRIAEDLLRYGIIEIVGTNIKIKETKHFKFIEDFTALKNFHYDSGTNPKHKVFIFDEAGKLAIKRGAMRKVNVEWMKFIPELSKGRMKLIVITQAEFLTDSIFTETDFTKATITTYKHKKGYSIAIESELLDIPRMYLNNFPKTSIKYGAYESAEWFLEPRQKDRDKMHLLCCDIAYDYAILKKSTNKIANERGYSTREKVIRLLKRHIRHTFNEMTPEDYSELKKDVLLRKEVKPEDSASEPLKPSLIT